MALRRALEMLKTGERINDQLYRWTVDRDGRVKRGERQVATRLDPWTARRERGFATS